jgi:iron complex transport system ATP-binding protein
VSADLNLSGVTAKLGGRPVLRAVSARITGGSFCCLLGPNGAGKTSLLRAITGYLQPTAGRVSLGDMDLGALSSRERAKHVALVPQLAPPVGPLTVFEAACLGLLPGGGGLGRVPAEDRDRVLQTLELLELDGLADQRCDELSGGEWRKVLVTQGIIQRADLLLLDEPTAFLDPPARRTILAAARSLCDSQGTTVVAVLHDTQFAAEFAHSALLLKHGAVMFHGPPAEATTEQRLAELYTNGDRRRQKETTK